MIARSIYGDADVAGVRVRGTSALQNFMRENVDETEYRIRCTKYIITIHKDKEP